MRRRLLIIGSICLLLVLCLMQESFVSALGRPFDLVHIPLFVALFAVSVFDDRVAFCALFISLFMRGMIATDFVVSLLLLGTLVFIILTELHFRFFTNRTLYAVWALSFIGWTLFILGEYAIRNAWQLIGANSQVRWVAPHLNSLVVSAIMLFLFLTVSYACTVIISKRIRSYFILPTRQ